MMALDDASWDDLRTLLAVVRTGSLSRAADELGITQPTVGRRLDRLEDVIGVPLVRRTARGCTPTERGEALLPAVVRMQEAADGVRRVASAAHNELAGLVRLATGDLPARYLVRRAADLPEGLQLEMLTAHGFVRLERGDADLALRNSAPEGDAWVVNSLGRVRYGVFASPTYAASLPGEQDRHLRDARWIGYPEEVSVRSARWLRPWLRREADLRLNNSVLQLEAAKAGVGLVVLPWWVGVDEEGLRPVGGPIDGLDCESFLVIHPSARRVRRVRWVAAWLREVITQRDPGTTTGAA